MSNVVLVEHKDGVCEISVNREESLNAIDYDVIRGLRDQVRNLREEITKGVGYDKTRLVVIRGKGRAFVAGADLKVMDNCSWEEVAQFIRLGQRLMREIEELPLPVLAVIDGFALGGGLELALSCDLIIATERSTLGQPETKLGIIPGFGGTQRLMQRVGIGRAKKVIYTGEPLSAKEAYDMGIIDWLVTKDESLEERLQEIVSTLKARGPLAIAAAKRAIAKGIEAQSITGFTKEVDEFLESFNSEDAQEGIRAFVEKRTPEFKGK